ncbi:hypothetical protein HMPREF1552_00521, partial [Leptotrichia sp. oral taxon 879 str. F0557]
DVFLHFSAKGHLLFLYKLIFFDNIFQNNLFDIQIIKSLIKKQDLNIQKGCIY